jgi:hypothetical protein
MPAAAAAASCVLPSIRFLRNTLTCASVIMEPHHPAPSLRAVRTAATGALDPVVLLQTIRAAQRELSIFSNRDTGAAGSSDQPRYLAAFATAWHSDYRAPKGRRKTTTKHWWRTRADPFAESWPLVEGWLVAEPNLAAAELLTRLCQRLPDLYPTGAQLRTLQRRVKVWRAERARQLVFAAASAGRAAFDSEATS